MKQVHPYFGLCGRVLLALMFVVAGYGKIGGYEGTQGYIEAMGVPGMVLPLVIVLELGGGLAIIAGWQTRIVAVLLAGFCLVAAIIFHLDFADPMESILFMKNLSVAGGFLLLAAYGPGALALDNRRS
ncbi:MAG: DoxX family protein [Gammaproteobacteria bacterium]|nr:DoxX family protein [Gammaproteobacteria bacterium]MDX2460921.1 DoxX family protein [Gammaproteobacteria bacterium]